MKLLHLSLKQWALRALGAPRRIRCLVTGTGRCGSVYLAKVLTDAGLPCGHESIFTVSGLEEARRRFQGGRISHSACSLKDGAWLKDPQAIVAEASGLAAPFLDEPFLSGVKVIHLVRHPLRVIHSYLNNLVFFRRAVPSNPWEAFMYRHLPSLTRDTDPLTRAADYFIQWNRMIERKIRHEREFFLRLETLEDQWGELLEFLGLERGLALRWRADGRNPMLHPLGSHRMLPVTLEDMRPDTRRALEDLSRAYGYDPGVLAGPLGAGGMVR